MAWRSATEMTDWRIVRKGEGDAPTLVEPVKAYVMKPGDSHFYDVGVVHSPKRDGLPSWCASKAPI